MQKYLCEESLMSKKRPVQRAYPKFQVLSGVSAALGETKIGAIANISRDGLVLNCFDINGQGEKGRRGSPKLSIFHENGFSLENVPCEILEERSQTQNVLGSCINQYHIQFKELTQEQKSQLEIFLNQFTDKQIISQ